MASIPRPLQGKSDQGRETWLSRPAPGCYEKVLANMQQLHPEVGQGADTQHGAASLADA